MLELDLFQIDRGLCFSSPSYFLSFVLGLPLIDKRGFVFPSSA